MTMIMKQCHLSKINDSLNEELSIKKQGESRTVVLLSQLQKKIETYDQEVRKLT